MNIADKSTLDLVNNLISRIGNYKGYKNTSASMKYYLPAGSKVVCERAKISVTQSIGEPELIDEGYRISNNSLVTITYTQGTYIEYVAYNIMQ